LSGNPQPLNRTAPRFAIEASKQANVKPTDTRLADVMASEENRQPGERRVQNLSVELGAQPRRGF
jgi:hypothetical protein